MYNELLQLILNALMPADYDDASEEVEFAANLGYITPDQRTRLDYAIIAQRQMSDDLLS